MQELENITGHCLEFLDDDPDDDLDISFYHDVLLSMCDVKHCPFDPYEPNTEGMTAVRDMFAHYKNVHRSQALSDVKRFIGLIREYRDIPLAGGSKFLGKLHQYFKRNIRRQPDFEVFKNYLESTKKVKMDGDYLDQVMAIDRPEDFKKEEHFPLTTAEFLKSFPRPPSRVGLGPGGSTGNIWDIMRARYAAGEI